MAPGRRRHRRPSRRPSLVALAMLATAAILTGTAVAATIGSGENADTSGRTLEPGNRAGASSESETRPRRTQRSEPDGVPPMAASDPGRLLVPSIGVDVDVMDLGLMNDGTLEVPPAAFPAGWYVGSPAPGELGPAVVAGHVRWNGSPGVFEELGELDVGDEIAVVRDDGSTADFLVTRTEQFAKDAFPTRAVYGDIDHAGLRLITCGGLDAESGTYEDNVVVFAELSATS